MYSVLYHSQSVSIVSKYRPLGCLPEFPLEMPVQAISAEDEHLLTLGEQTVPPSFCLFLWLLLGGSLFPGGPA